MATAGGERTPPDQERRHSAVATAEKEADLPAHGRHPAPGIYYQCQRCANCCRWPGIVKVDDADIAAIAAFLGLGEDEFIQHHTRLRPQRDGLALLDKLNGECAFLDGGDCTIQPVKPSQCHGFPNAWNFPGWRDVCEAVPVRVI